MNLGQPASQLTLLTAPWPFAQWGIDILGPFPSASGQRKFLLVAIDYFMEWVEAEPLALITESKVESDKSLIVSQINYINEFIRPQLVPNLLNKEEFAKYVNFIIFPNFALKL